ncbi:MAG: DUF5723 family protein [Bacteroidales bacterium]|nr:DUF5723 family protein [Bacteroidales bacterium]
MRKITIIINFIILVFAVTVYSQTGASLGLGGFTAVSRGVESVYWNPANLSFMEKNQSDFQMVIYALNVGTGNNSFSFNSLNKYIGDGESIYLTDSDKKDILNNIKDNGLMFDMLGKASLFSFCYKNYGFGIETKAYGNMSIPKDLYENILFKFGHDIYDYSVNGIGYGLMKFKLSYGRTLFEDLIFEVPLLKNTIFKEISAGISLSYLQGVGFAEIEKGQAELEINDSGILPKVNFRAKRATSGSGLGMDIGFGAYTNNNWKIGMMFENLLGGIRWNKGAEMATSSIDFGSDLLFILGEGQLAEIEMDSVSSDTTYSISDFSQRLPLNFRMGIAKDLGKYLVNFEIGGENKKFFTAIGGRINFDFFNWYASIGHSIGNFHWNTAFAINFKHFYFDVGVSSRGGLTLGHSKALFVGSSMRFGF